MKYNIGAKIKKIRLSKGLSQTQMATLLNMTQSAYSRIETDGVNVIFEQIISIAYITEAALYEFFPNDLAELQQINFRMQMQDYYNEIESLKKELAYQKDINKELIERNKELKEKLTSLGVPPPPQILKLT
jgi:transcriptional regulator with XRE-family HTH domain